MESWQREQNRIDKQSECHSVLQKMQNRDLWESFPHLKYYLLKITQPH